MSSGINRKLLPKEADEIIREIEVKHDLLTYKVSGWCAWCLLRFPVQLAVAYNLGGQDSFWPRSERSKLVARDLLGIAKLKHIKHVVKTYSSGLLEQKDG